MPKKEIELSIYNKQINICFIYCLLLIKFAKADFQAENLPLPLFKESWNNMIINTFGIVKESIVDGIGIRYVIFTQGCPHNCKGCHNPETHEFVVKKNVCADEILEDIKKNPLLKGVTFSGGEPFCQSEPLLYIAKKVKEMGKDIWCYSGYTFDELEKNPHPFSAELLELVDVLVDGKFILEERDLRLKFRGSKNQRVIDCKKTREMGKITLYEFE